MKNLLLNYIVYVIYFLGMGLVSSGIVLMPFNIMRYSIILAIGLSIFILGTFLNEFIINKNKLTLFNLLKLIFLSLSLAIGIGMISGGISHFKESPSYVTYLIPLGFLISFISYTVKNNYKFPKKDILSLTVIALIIALMLYSGLSYLSSGMTTTGGDIFKTTDKMH